MKPDQPMTARLLVDTILFALQHRGLDGDKPILLQWGDSHSPLIGFRTWEGHLLLESQVEKADKHTAAGLDGVNLMALYGLKDAPAEHSEGDTAELWASIGLTQPEHPTGAPDQETSHPSQESKP